MKILFVRLSSLGDIVVTFPLVSYFKQKFQESEITFLVKSEYKELVALNKDIDNIMLFDKNTDTISVMREKIKAHNFDYIFDLHNNQRSNLFCMLNGAKKSRFNKRSIRKKLLVYFKINCLRDFPPISIRYSQSLAKFNFFEKYDFKEYLEKYSLDVSGEEIDAAYQKFPFLKDYDHLIGVCPSARHKTKMMPIDKLTNIIKNLSEQENNAILLLGSKDEYEYCEKIRIQIANNNCFNLAGKTSIDETSTVIHECNLVVTNDTGLMHLTNMVGTSLIAVFGSTVKEFGFFPKGSKAFVFEDKTLSCRPCSHIGLSECPKGHFKCMMNIDEEIIIQKAKDILNSKKM